MGGADPVALQTDAQGTPADYARQPAERLRPAAGGLLRVAGSLGDKLGALLFQLPPTAKKDLPLFDAFLNDLPPGARGAFEFRHVSWLDDEVFERLRRRNLALCVADSEKMSTPVQMTADYAYFDYATRDTHRRASLAGPTRLREKPPIAATCSSTSSTKKKARPGVRETADAAFGNRIRPPVYCPDAVIICRRDDSFRTGTSSFSPRWRIVTGSSPAPRAPARPSRCSC